MIKFNLSNTLTAETETHRFNWEYPSATCIEGKHTLYIEDKQDATRNIFKVEVITESDFKMVQTMLKAFNVDLRV